MKETWKQLYYYDIPTDYDISDYGRIWSRKTFKYIHQNKCGKYLKVSLCINNKVIQTYVHRLVCMNFVPIPNNLISNGYDMHSLEVNHKRPYNKHINKASNLEWCTSSYNKLYDYDTGVRNVGKLNHLNTTNSEEQIHEVCKLLESNKYSIPKISEMTGVDYSVIYDILIGDIWRSISNQYNISNYTNKNVKYDRPIIDRILSLYALGETRAIIADKLNLNYKTVCYIINKNK